MNTEFGGFVSKANVDSPPLNGSPCISEDNLPIDSKIFLYIAIGDPAVRKKVSQVLSEKYPLASFPNLIHPSAIVSVDAQFDSGNLILPFSIVCPASKMGSFNILNIYSSVAHDSVIGSYCTLSPYATLNGGAQCEDMAFVGSHATVAPSVIMEKNSTLSANSLATKTVLANSLAFGVPAKSLKPKI